MNTLKKKRRYLPESGHRRRLRHRYGISVKEYDQLVDEQQGRCAICDEIPKKLYLDHDHETGKPRQLLCPGCNTMIGGLENLKNGDGMKYLMKHQATNALARLELELRAVEEDLS